MKAPDKIISKAPLPDEIFELAKDLYKKNITTRDALALLNESGYTNEDGTRLNGQGLYLKLTRNARMIEWFREQGINPFKGNQTVAPSTKQVPPPRTKAPAEDDTVQNILQMLEDYKNLKAENEQLKEVIARTKAVLNDTPINLV